MSKTATAPDDTLCLTVEEAAHEVRTNAKQIYRAIRARELPAMKLGKGYSLLRTDLIKWCHFKKALRKR